MKDDKPSEQGKNKAFIDNQWKPGQSGNPGGRPKDPGITAGQIEKLDQACPFDGKGRTWREYLIEKGLLQAGESPKAMEHLKERLEGKVATLIATPDSEGKPSKIEIVIVRNEEIDKDSK